MKRIFPLALICVILLSSLVPNASATEVWEDDIFFDVLSYSFPNDSNSMICFASGNKVTANFKLPEGRYIRYVDFIFQVAKKDTVPTVTVGVSATASQKSLTMVELGNNRYRVYGAYNQYSPNICITVTASSLQAVTFDSFRISYQTIDAYDETGSCLISASGYTNTINYIPSDMINYRNFIGSSDYSLNGFTTTAWCDNWRKYDFMDFVFYYQVGGINSVSVTIGDSIVPAEVSYLNSNGVMDRYEFTVRIDLRNVNRITTERLTIEVNGKVNPGEDNFISFEGLRGYIDAGEVNLLYVFLRNIVTELSNIKTSLVGDSTSANEFKDDSSELVSGLDGISASMDSVQRPSMDSINMDFTTNIGTASILVGNLFNQLLSVPWLSSIFIASVTIALISYILYGKD